MTDSPLKWPPKQTKSFSECWKWLECFTYTLGARTGQSKFGPCSSSELGRVRRDMIYALNVVESTLGTEPCLDLRMTLQLIGPNSRHEVLTDSA